LVFVFAAAYVGSDIGEVLACEHRYDTRHRFSLGRVDGANSCMRVGAAQKFSFDHPGN
jgi:hypothetical protein